MRNFIMPQCTWHVFLDLFLAVMLLVM